MTGQPFIDLRAQYLSIKPEIDAAIAAVIDQSVFIGGPFVEAFEAAFAAYVDAKHCVGCANGTDSIEILLEAMGIGVGDEVIVPAHTWISTAEAVSRVGAKPVFVDTQHASYTIDVTRIVEKINAHTRAIIPVHLYGQPADMAEILVIAEHHGLRVIEDCAQAHGATYRGRRVGTFGEAASFSFYPGKNLGAYGDAGCIVTNDQELATRFRMIANHGRLGKHDHSIEGRNSRLDGMQAAILLAKLPHLDRWIDARRQHAALYKQMLAPLGITLPEPGPEVRHAFHLFVVQVPERELVRTELRDAGVETGIHYPIALPMLQAYRSHGYRPEEFPVAIGQMGRLLSLPMYAELTKDMVVNVCNALRDALLKVDSHQEQSG